MAEKNQQLQQSAHKPITITIEDPAYEEERCDETFNLSESKFESDDEVFEVEIP